MSWNCPENKILEDDLDKLGEDKKLKSSRELEKNL